MFIECTTCSQKQGSPVLCGGCLNNRNTITAMLSQIAELKRGRADDEELIESLRHLVVESGKKISDQLDHVRDLEKLAHSLQDQLGVKAKRINELLMDTHALHNQLRMLETRVVRTTEPCIYCSGWKKDGSTCSVAAYTDTFSCEQRGG